MDEHQKFWLHFWIEGSSSGFSAARYPSASKAASWSYITSVPDIAFVGTAGPSDEEMAREGRSTARGKRNFRPITTVWRQINDSRLARDVYVGPGNISILGVDVMKID